MKPKMKKNNIGSAITKKKQAASDFELTDNTDDNIVQPSAARIQKVIRPGGRESYELVDDGNDGGMDESCIALIFILDIALIVGGVYLYQTMEKCLDDDKVQYNVSSETEIFTTTTIAKFAPTTTLNSGALSPVIPTTIPPNLPNVPTTLLITTTISNFAPTTTLNLASLSPAIPTTIPPALSNVPITNSTATAATATVTASAYADPTANDTATAITTVPQTELNSGASYDSGEDIKWPWYIRLTKRDNPGSNHFNVLCSAAIVSPLNALTAMTCFKGMSKFNIVQDVRGAFGKDFALQNLGSYYKVINVRHHPLGRSLPLLFHDLTLLTFYERPWTDSRITPVRLPSMEQRKGLDDKDCFVLNWATSQLNQQKCTANFVDTELCKNNFEDTTVVEGAAFCLEFGDIAARCQPMMETGSPMVCKEDNFWYLYGIKSDTSDSHAPYGQALFAEVAQATDWICCLFPEVWSCSKPSMQSLPPEKICRFPKNVNYDDVVYSSVMEVNAEPWSMRLHMKKHWSSDVYEMSKCEATIISLKYAVTSTSCLAGKSKAWIISSVAGTTRHNVLDGSKDLIRVLSARHEPISDSAYTVPDDFTVLVFHKKIPASDLNSRVYFSIERRMLQTERCFVAFSRRPAGTQIYCPVFFASVAECQEQFPSEMKGAGSSFCVRLEETQENIDCLCKVLRGSPMVCEKDLRWYLRGVTSLEDGCKEKNLLLLSDVHNNLHWLCCILKIQNCKNVPCAAG